MAPDPGGRDGRIDVGWLAEAAGVTKPVVYDHFGTRNGLLAALYEDYDVRQTAIIDGAIAASRPTLEDKARVIKATSSAFSRRDERSRRCSRH